MRSRPIILASALRRSLSTALVALMLTPATTLPSFALSELKSAPGQQQQQPAEEQKTAPAPTTEGLPLPDPLVTQPSATDEDLEGEDGAAPADDAGSNEPAPGKPAPGTPPLAVLRDVSDLPSPVRKMRERLVEAAASGDLERLRELMGSGSGQTLVTTGEQPADPVTAIREMSGDQDGYEILASMLNILTTGFVRLNPGTPDEVYVWPYFVGRPLADLKAPEKVELLRIVTSGDFSDMQEFDGYNFYRIGIAPSGQWKFFLSGD